MSLKNLIPALSLLLFFATGSAHAEQNSLQPFVPGSYQQILAQHINQPFVLAIWSITCPSCLKDMALINELHKEHPKLKIIMLTTDDLSASEQISNILSKNDLASLENWVYADENTQKLQYEIDSKWYGELPRTYFFDAAHQRTGISGTISKQDFEARLTSILK